MGWFKQRESHEQERVNEEVRRLLGDDRIANAYKVQRDGPPLEVNQSPSGWQRDGWLNSPDSGSALR